MQTHSRNAPTVNGSVKGRGLAHRKWTAAERIAYAADVATGERQLDLSQQQLCQVFHVTSAALRAEIKARTNGNGHKDMLEVAKSHLRAIVDQVGLSSAIDLLSEIEAYGREG
jgi:hypothetical protein